jgi:hypothetical protein
MKMILTAVGVSFLACGGSGSAVFTTWGEEYIEEGIPAQVGSEAGFVDGWSVKYSKFLVVVKEIALAQKTGGRGPKQMGAQVVDLTLKGPVTLQTFANTPAGKWDQVSYSIGPDANPVGVGSVTAADVEAMKAGKLGVWVEGLAVKGSTSKRFSWRFALDSLFENCSNPDFGEGLTVPVGGTETAQLTIHGDHFFYDDLQNGDAALRFEAIASADRDRDGLVSLEELAAVPLTTVPAGTYGTGGAGNVKTLRDFVSELSRTIGHFRGEGECTVKARVPSL